MSRIIFLFLIFFAAAAPAWAEALPAVEEVAWKPFRAHGLELLKGLEAAKGALPADTTKTLRALLDKEKGAVAQAEKLLDAHCLVGVHINAESRVKVKRGPAAAALVLGKPTLVLVKVHNEAGVQHPLTVEGPQVRKEGEKGEGRWLEAEVLNAAPFAKRLSGRRLEYRVLRLTPREAGKREATLRFDAGQGSEDLGFRAEVPILFTVRTR